MQITTKEMKIENWITDQLPGPMVGGLAATSNLMERMRKRCCAKARAILSPANGIN